MKTKRLLAALLTAALMVSLAVLPAGAAPGSFDDVSDPVTAVNADILRLMGVVDGTGGNMFDPNGTLTRAQFCAMTIRFLQREDEVQRYATRTIFTDVKSTHWARGYVNLAASAGTGEEKETPLVSGVGNGLFLPDSQISLAEAVTILLRALGYSDQQVSAVWPQGYLDLAASIGLTSGLSAGAYDSISRAQAAQLFVNALKCKTSGGDAYYKSLGSTVYDAIILAVDVETDDGTSKGAILAAGEGRADSYLPVSGDGNPIALQGKWGDMVVKEDKIVTFIPDDSTAVTITLSGDAQAVYMKGSDGRQYTIASDAKVYTAAAGEGKDYSQAFTSLVSGTRVTLYSRNGKVKAVYAALGSTETTTDAVVVMGAATTATFHQLTGGASNFTVVKNRQPIRLSDIKPYDVVTYDKLTNTLVVSDLRLTCVYGSAVPNTKTPLTITALEDTFEVLESAWNTCGDFKPGDTVTLLLTADGKVAGMATAGKARSNAIGFVDDNNKVEIFLPNGTSRTMGSSLASSTNLDSQLVSVSLNKNGINASRLPSRTAPGALDLTGMTLGGYTVSAGVRLYEQVSGGAMVETNRGELGMGSIPASQISGYQLNSSDIVEYIILKDITGNAYEYGMMVMDPRGTEEEPITGWKLENKNRTPIKFADSVGYSGRSGDMVGVVKGKKQGDNNTISAIIKLTEVKNVKQSDFFESQGVPHITVNGRTYRIAEDVECCYNLSANRRNAEWMQDGDGAQRLSAIRAYSDSFTIYVDPVGQQVRVIAAN